MKQISIETKTSIINRFNNGESVSELTEATGVARSTIYGWIKAAQSDSENKLVNRKTVNDLESKVIRLSTLIEILQKVFDVENIPTRIRLEELEKLYGDYNVHNLCDALMVPRGTFYNHIKECSSPRVSLRLRPILWQPFISSSIHSSSVNLRKSEAFA